MWLLIAPFITALDTLRGGVGGLGLNLKYARCFQVWGRDQDLLDHPPLMAAHEQSVLGPCLRRLSDSLSKGERGAWRRGGNVGG